MKQKTKDTYDFTDFLLDDEFIRRVKDELTSDDYLAELKSQNPLQEKEIDMALQVMESMENTHLYSTKDQRFRVWSGIVGSFSTSNSELTTTTPFQFNFKTQRARNLLRFAAGFMLLIGIGTAAFYFSKNNDKELSFDRFVSSNPVDYNKSQLILSGNKKIEIPTGDSRIIYSADGANVTINDTSSNVQRITKKQFNQMIVPYGKYASLQLSDGTKVWLNAGSRMVFPPIFKGKFREVYLQGEGYFEVTKKVGMPFHVRTDQLTVEVLGTKFDVMAYAQENRYSALLLEGRVSLTSHNNSKSEHENLILKQGEKGEISETSNKFVLEKVSHPENFIAWTYGYMNFEEETLESLLKRISRHYNVEIQLRSVTGSFKISGKLDLKENPDRVLKGIAVISKMKLYKQKGGYLIKD